MMRWVRARIFAEIGNKVEVGQLRSVGGLDLCSSVEYIV